jgi:hypothetical protein
MLCPVHGPRSVWIADATAFCLVFIPLIILRVPECIYLFSFRNPFHEKRKRIKRKRVTNTLPAAHITFQRTSRRADVSPIAAVHISIRQPRKLAAAAPFRRRGDTRWKTRRPHQNTRRLPQDWSLGTQAEAAQQQPAPSILFPLLASLPRRIPPPSAVPVPFRRASSPEMVRPPLHPSASPPRARSGFLPGSARGVLAPRLISGLFFFLLAERSCNASDLAGFRRDRGRSASSLPDSWFSSGRES